MPVKGGGSSCSSEEVLVMRRKWGTGFTSFINIFAFRPGIGRLWRSKHPTSDESPAKAFLTPAPVSRLNRIELAGSDHDDFPSAILVLKSLLFYNSLQ
jgi:hypothetical protein